MGGHGGIKAYFSLFKLAATRRIMAAELLIGLAAGISAVSGAMFITSVKHFTLSDFASQISALFLISILSSPIWVHITQRLQKQHALMLGAGCYIIGQRSEEHTSELQSLMRISYAVFCLNTKKTNREEATITLSATQII